MKILPSLVLASTLFLFAVQPLFPLTITLDDNYPPYSFRDVQGNLQGILIDLWDLWSRKTGEPAVLKALPWSEALATMAEGKADVLDTVFQTPARSLVFDFTPAYASIQTAVFHRAGLVGITGPANLKGYLVGVKSGDAGADALRASGVEGLKEFPSYEAMIDAAARGEIHAFCMDVPPALHLLYAKGLSSQFREAFVLSEDSFHRAVPKGHLATLALVSRGFALMTPDEVGAIENRWLGTALPDAANRQTVAITVIIALVVIALLGAVVFSLRLQVKRRQGQLAGTEELLRLSENRARAVLNALPDLMCEFNSEGTIQSIHVPTPNTQFLDPSPESLVGQKVFEIFGGPLSREEFFQLLRETPPGKLVTLERDIVVHDATRTLDIRIVQMDVDLYFSIVRDITDSRRAWQDDLQRNKLESLGVLAGGLAHDFNNSLAVIQGFVSLARVQLANPEKALASLDKAVLATRRAAGLTSQLRVLAHGSEVHRRILSVRDLAEEAASFALVGSPCVLAVEASEGSWAVEADPDQLSQVFHNLVLNAVQAMPRGGTVSLVFRRPAPERISVSVVDQGTGIPAEDLSRIFDPYFTTKPKGTGLGLSVVHAVVQRHGGWLEVESREGRGTVFTVHLLAATGPVDDMKDGRFSHGPTFQGQRVLLMEDEGDLRDLMVQVLSSLGLDPVACRNGTEAIAAFDAALAEGRPFLLVVSDLLVPGDMGGREMIAVLRSRPGSFRALAVTGFSTERNTEDFHSQGFDVIVGKPFTVDEFKTRIVELMKGPWKTASNT